MNHQIGSTPDLQVDNDIKLEYQFLKDTLADNPEEKSVRDGKKGEDISVTVQTETDANFDVTKVAFGSFSWDSGLVLKSPLYLLIYHYKKFDRHC